MPNTRAHDERALGSVELVALGVNGIIGVGIFFAPSQVAGAVPGGSGLWVYALVGLALLPVALVYAALGSRFSVRCTNSTGAMVEMGVPS